MNPNLALPLPLAMWPHAKPIPRGFVPAWFDHVELAWLLATMTDRKEDE